MVILQIHPEREIALHHQMSHMAYAANTLVFHLTPNYVFSGPRIILIEKAAVLFYMVFIRGICPFTQHCRRRANEKRTVQSCCRKVPARETSIITRLFEGQLSYSITCLKCENCTYKNEVFTILSLPIPSGYECSLQVGSPQLLTTFSCF